MEEHVGSVWPVGQIRSDGSVVWVEESGNIQIVSGPALRAKLREFVFPLALLIAICL